MCDTKFSVYLYYVRLESVHVQMVMYPLGFRWYVYFNMCLVWVFSLGMILALFHFVSLSCFYHFLCFT